jgi:hypothetical protein
MIQKGMKGRNEEKTKRGNGRRGVKKELEKKERKFNRKERKMG